MDISSRELSRKVRDAGYNENYIEVLEPKAKQLVNGDVYFSKLPSGINLHYCDVTENTSGQSTAKLDPCLSVNFLLAGKVSFALSNNKYDFEASEEVKNNSSSSAVMFINILNAKHVFTRYFHQNRHVKKLNMTVSKSWLLERCGHDTENKEIESLFLSAQPVYQWSCSTELLTLIENLFIDLKNKTSKYQWELEQQAFSIFTQAFQLLQVEVNQKDNNIDKDKKAESTDIMQSINVYESKIAKLIKENNNIELSEVSSSLGASISTLQRYFKSKYQLTLKEYIRNEKLEEARGLLIFDKKSVGEVSYLVGYKHVSNFSSAFKKYFSITPAALQHEYKNLRK
ncbi:AraC family transcriptional regulator [Colwellia sp. E2M01]|uniref:helix-turn-helix transcriptional regulator n=1 Tax=Colwellia sp. E2M01 TaxID=2841561 RepID=UPI001C09ADC9|nr:AraC family transcriptional regulator [Colwellia sp. E2M01]MBU2869318.1 AraC family transcriptional regulator [Colwellia sp. E2M01]